MNKRQLDILIENQVKKQLKEEYWRLPKKVIGNDLYAVSKQLNTIYQWLSYNNDYKEGSLDNIIKKLIEIKKTAKKFNGEEEPSDADYR